MSAVDRYFEGLQARDWKGVGACLADDVQRTGPYLDVVRGRRDYVDFLSRVLPSLRGYELKLFRIREVDGGSVLAELSETVEVDGVRTEFPEVILFDLDERGLICRVDVYVKQLAGSRGAPAGDR